MSRDFFIYVNRRFVSNSSLFREIVLRAKSGSNVRMHVGGNAALMAARFAQEGAQVLLGAHMTSKLRGELPPGVVVSGPKVDEDEHHILLEYSSGEKFFRYQSPRANRFIIHNDYQNPRFLSVEGFSEMMVNFKPSLLVLGGLHTMDHIPLSKEFRDEAFAHLVALISGVPADTAIHFEMASFVDTDLLQQVKREILPHAESLGMNEQELPNLISLLRHGNVTHLADSYPRVAAVLDQMRDLFGLLYSLRPRTRPLARIHLHTLAFQAILRVVEDSENSVHQWKNTRAATAKAALTAHRHTCVSRQIDVHRARVIMDDSFSTSDGPTRKRIPFVAEEPVRCWNETLRGLPPDAFVVAEICVAPVLVCTQVNQTGGGGDNVSAAGLVLQV